MKVVDPKPLLREAAEVLAPVVDETVVIGAIALDVALHGKQGSVTPTRDIDLVVATEDAEAVVACLLEAEMVPSQEEHERGFTWVRDELKVQLIRPYHPFPKGSARGLPENPVVALAQDPAHRNAVAFAGVPGVRRFWSVTPACLLGLKKEAFGRSRPDGGIVERDYHDAFLILSDARDDLQASYSVATPHVQALVRGAAEQLAEDGEATMRAASQMVRLDAAATQREAERMVVRSAREFLRGLSG